jgi:hypothetical protein
LGQGVGVVAPVANIANRSLVAGRHPAAVHAGDGPGAPERL